MFTLTLAACGNDVAVVHASGSGSTGAGATSSSTGGGGAGGAPNPGPHDVMLALDVPSPGQAAEVLVLLNHGDGTLVESWLGSVLPVVTSATDGDLVTYAYLTAVHVEGVGYMRSLESFRVSPSLKSVRVSATPLNGDPPKPCDEQSMTLHLHVLPLPDAPPDAKAWVRSSPPGAYASATSFPADITLTPSTCAPVDAFAILMTVEGEVGQIYGFAAQEGIPFVPGSVVDLTIQPANMPRKPLAIAVDEMEGPADVDGWCNWDGAMRGYPTFFVHEHGLDLQAKGVVSTMLYAPDLIDLAAGDPGAYVSADQHDGGCLRRAELFRVGRSDTTLPLHVQSLAEATRVGETWTLGSGSVGDDVETDFTLAENWMPWRVHEDPTAPPAPVVYPTFPSDVPKGLEDVSGLSPVWSSTMNRDYEERDGFASIADFQGPAVPSTLRTRGTVCF